MYKLQNNSHYISFSFLHFSFPFSGSSIQMKPKASRHLIHNQTKHNDSTSFPHFSITISKKFPYLFQANNQRTSTVDLQHYEKTQQ